MLTYQFLGCAIPAKDIVIENCEDGIPSTLENVRESQVICVHILMNYLSDKLTIVLYGKSPKKLQKKPLRHTTERFDQKRLVYLRNLILSG